jgi:hypothetical protein
MGRGGRVMSVDARASNIESLRSRYPAWKDASWMWETEP